MIYLLLSIVCSTAIFLLFKSFSYFRLHTFQAIVVNYLVAGTAGLLLTPDWSVFQEGYDQPWFSGGLLLGFLFITLFYLMAWTSQHVGVSAASVATKMSLVLSVLYFVITDPDEQFTVWKSLGVILAIPGVYLASVKKKDKGINLRLLLIPLVIFVGSGVIDTTIGFMEKHHLHDEEAQSAFASLPFIGAFSLGAVVLLWQFLKMGKRPDLRSMAGGLVLGLVNYGSILFLIKAFDAELLDRSSLIPVNNLGVVAGSSLAAVLVFKEELSVRNKLGIVLSVVAMLVLLIRT